MIPLCTHAQPVQSVHPPAFCEAEDLGVEKKQLLCLFKCQRRNSTSDWDFLALHIKIEHV